MWATCNTSGCGNTGIPVDVGDMSWVDEETGATHTITEVSCGVCGKSITELTDTAPPPAFEEEQIDG